MQVSHLKLKNWRNFKAVDVALFERTYLLGPNASGKSNFLEVFRFLRDICKSTGGGLQGAIKEHGGVQKLRCLHARKDTEVRIEIGLVDGDDDTESWRYVLGFKREGKGANRILISAEEVWHQGRNVLMRPDSEDRRDPVRLTQTALEQIQVNSEFRQLSDFFGATTYLHLVPQLLKFGNEIGGRRIESDPFGQGFLERVARATPKVRDARLRRIAKALQLAVPQFRDLRFKKDDVTGHPHLEALYTHYRPNAGWQREEQFSDGTLRLLGLLWILLEGDSLLLLEEPELSLNDSIVKQIPEMISSVQKDRKRRARQVLISTHSEGLLSNNGIDARGVLLLEPASEGTTVRHVNAEESGTISSGFSIAEVVLPKTRPTTSGQLAIW